MKEKIVEIINDEDSYIPPEWLIYSKSNSAIVIVKNEIDELIKQLKIAVKAGDFDDYFDREAPALFEKLEKKREELVSILHYERTKEKRKDVFRVDPKQFVIPEEQAVVSLPSPAPMLAEIPKTIEQKLSVLAKISQSYSDANLYIAGILGIILVVVQLMFNFTFENRLKNNVQETVVQNLENRLRLAENKNINLAQNISQLRQRSNPNLLNGKTKKNGVFVLGPVKFKQDPVLVKLYKKEKEEALLAARKAAELAKQKRKISSVAKKSKSKPKNKLSAAKTPRYSKRN